MSSKIWDANPLVVALFDLPAGIQAYSKKALQSNINKPQGRDVSDSDETSLQCGESITYADDGFSAEDGDINPSNTPRPLLFTSYFPTFGPPFAKLPSVHNPDMVTSRKKKKKRRSDMIQVSNKTGGRKSERSKSSDAPRMNQLPPNATQHDFDDFLSLKRVTNLKLQIQRIRLSIVSLENDLIETRSELVRAHRQLHFATLELESVKRTAFEADFGLFQLAQHQERLSTSHSYNISARSSICSDSSDRHHYLTPRSTLDGNDSVSSTPQSISSYESFYSSNESDNTNTESLQGRAQISTEDKDKTPLKKNGKLKQTFLTVPTKDIGREPSSICTSIAVVSLREETCVDQSGDVANSEQSKQEGGRGKHIYRYESFIRAHDLSLSGDVDNSTIVSLQTTDVADIANALFQKGYECAMDESERWTPEQGTGKLLCKRVSNLSHVELDGPIGDWLNAAYGDEVLVWTSKCIHGGYGSEYPMVKARGLIPTSALKMVELLLDSDRVKEYNKMSLGRIDEHCFAIGVERLTECPSTGILGELKIVRSKSQPPVVRKPIELRLLLHARRLSSEGNNNTSNYLTIGRSIWETEHGTADTDENSVTRCEMLLSVNLIRDIPSYNNEWCEITTITHGISPGIPISIGKRIGLAAAAKYIRDIRAVFVNA